MFPDPFEDDAPEAVVDEVDAAEADALDADAELRDAAEADETEADEAEADEADMLDIIESGNVVSKKIEKLAHYIRTELMRKIVKGDSRTAVKWVWVCADASKVVVLGVMPK